jgi:hypothetical protein
VELERLILDTDTPIRHNHGAVNPAERKTMNIKQENWYTPEDLSWDASAKRAQEYRSGKCGDGPATPPFPDYRIATLDNIADWLETVTEGKDADFCQSLAAQYRAKGTWSAKQVLYAQRLYQRWFEQEQAWLNQQNRHQWVMAGHLTHQYEKELGTFKATTYYRCAKCDAIGEEYKSNNWSGD